MEELLKQLTEIGGKYKDPGVTFDVVTFHDGENWRAVIDTKGEGDLTQEKPLADFAVERKYATFGYASFLCNMSPLLTYHASRSHI